MPARAERLLRLAAALALACPGTHPAQAEEKPLWEAGLGVAVIDFPDYRGSDERQTFLLPLPYLIYRGDLLQADREGARSRFFRSDRMELDVSLNGSIPVDSSDNQARRGMPDLDPTLEIGPSLKVKLLRDAARSVHVGLTLPVRTVIATDFSHTKNVGWTFEPRLDVDFRDTWLGEGWNLGVGAGPLFGDKRFHNYFLGVPAQYATAARPAYVAEGGYGGVRGLVAVSRKFPSFWFGAFVRADTLAGSELASSPLVRQKASYAAGVAVTWMLGQSERMVTVED
jgi:outer membrane scaffolding protein for murein synthesis (MipA/OmpV family)